MMRLAVLKERREGETRVAATPETVKKLIALGLNVAVEAGAGLHSALPDADYAAAGAEVVGDAEMALAGAGVVFAVQAPDGAARAALPRGALLVCTAGAHADPGLAPAMAAAGVDLAAMELLPRITRAQSMDVLSSQANLAGFRAVVEAAAAFERGFPMMMTAAGTVPPARVFIIGAGVAGLQAIATARRLGGIVSATDVRPTSREEVRSLGATFVGVDSEQAAQTAGGYAKEMTDAFRQKQAELMATTVAKNDIVICTALVMGRRAPTIVTRAMVAAMRPGSVIVDLAAEAGGNCEATVPGERIVTENGVTILGYRNWPARIAVAASNLYSRNLLTFLTSFWDKAASAPKLPDSDEIVRGVMITRGGQVVHAQFAAAAPSQTVDNTTTSAGAGLTTAPDAATAAPAGAPPTNAPPASAPPVPPTSASTSPPKSPPGATPPLWVVPPSVATQEPVTDAASEASAPQIAPPAAAPPPSLA